MKTLSTKTTRNSGLYSLLIIILSFSVLFQSCSKDDNSDISAGISANVMIVNAVEGSQPQDFYLNSTKVNTQAVAYAQNSSYISTTSGSKTAEFRNTGSATATATSAATLENGKYYTFYYTGSGSSASAAKTEDDMTAPPSGKAKVRFINLNSSSTANVDFALNGTTLSSNIAYKTASNFATVDAGAVTFKVLAAGTSTLYFDLPATLQAGKIYTIWVTGNTLLTAHVLAHN